MNSQERIEFIDGIKGYAALIVFISHLFASFINDFDTQLHIRAEHILYNTPLTVIFNGHYMVALFLILSGFLIAKKVLIASDNEISLLFIKRYFRLVIPVIPVSLFVYFCMRFNLFYNQYVENVCGAGWIGLIYQKSSTFFEMFMCTFLRMPFGGNETVTPVLWMISYSLIGTLFSIAMIFVWRYHPKIFWIFGSAMTLYFLFYENSLYACSMIGAMTAILDNKVRINFKSKNVEIVAFILVVLGILGGGYTEQTQLHYQTYAYLGRLLTDWQIYIVSQTFFFVGILMSPNMQKVFSRRFISFIGEISYGIYLIQIPLLCTISSYLFVKVNEYCGLFFTSWFTLIVSIVLVIVCAWLFTKWIEKPLNKLIFTIFKV